VYAAICLLLFFAFPDTWRRERSRVYQNAMERAVRRAIQHDEAKEKKRARKAARGLPSNAPTPPTTGMPTPVMSRRASLSSANAVEAVVDVEKGAVSVKRPFLARIGLRKNQDDAQEKIAPGWRDVNPFPHMWAIYSRPSNAMVLFASGFLFAGSYTIVYTAAVTLARAPYEYNPLNVGLVLLSFGVGSMAGSIGGGKYSDVVLRRLKERNGGVSVPEVSKLMAWLM
jgi:hypothetical protein